MTPRVYEFAAIAIALILVGTLAYLAWDGYKLLLSNGQPVFGDFIAFWSAGRAALDGYSAEVHNMDVIARYHQAAVPGVLYVAPWNSPPPFLLIAMVFAMLPYPAAALAFLAITGGIYLFAARKLVPDTRLLIFAVTLPAALYHLGTVQTGLLIAGITGLALVWLDRRPLRAGALIGLLVIKPHLAILWPLLLALTGRWRAFMAALISTVAFVVLAGVVFGFDSYVRFLENLGPSNELVSGQHIATPAYASLYGNLLGLGFSPEIAGVTHAISAIAALLVALAVFARGDKAVAGAALCAGTLLISPYLFFYDFTLLAVAAALLGTPRDRTELVAYIFAWGAGLSLAIGYIVPLPVAPLAAWLMLRVAFRRARSAGVVRAPVLQP